MDTYTRKQEIVNGLVHGAGVLFGVAGLPVLTGIATAHGNTPGIIGSGIYGLCFLMTFTVSTVFHMARDPAVRRTFKILDHISIFFFISGSYTPFLLVYMNNSFGNSLLVILWSLTAAGTIFKIFFTGRYEVISTMIYLAMGWIMVVGGRKFFDHIPVSVLVFVIAGAILYSIGAFLYLWDKYPYTHAVWHAFVLAAALCHYVAVLLAM